MAQPIIEKRVREQIFADPQQENYICTAGTKYMNRFLESGRLGKAFAVLSDCSVYCKGKFLVQKKGAPAAKRLAEYRVDIPEISSVKHVRTHHSWLLVLSILFLILAPLMPVVEPLINKMIRPKKLPLTPWIDAVVCLLIAGVFCLLFFLHRKTLLQISYSRGKISLDAGKLPPAEERTFVKKLRTLLAAWDEYVEQQRYQDTYTQVFDQAFDHGYQSGFNQAYTPGYVQGFQSGIAQAAPPADPPRPTPVQRPEDQAGV